MFLETVCFMDGCSWRAARLDLRELRGGRLGLHVLAWQSFHEVGVMYAQVSEKENVDEDILKCGTGAATVEIDLMQPLDINKSPKVHIPPLNHIGLW